MRAGVELQTFQQAQKYERIFNKVTSILFPPNSMLTPAPIYKSKIFQQGFKEP